MDRRLLANPFPLCFLTNSHTAGLFFFSSAILLLLQPPPLQIVSPYKDGILTAAQVFAVLAFLLSFAGILGGSLLLALVSLVLFLSSCCCSMNKCGLVTAGVFGCVTALVLILLAVAIPANLKDNQDELRKVYGDEAYEAFTDQVETRTSLMMAAAVLWVIASVLIFLFSCTLRYQRAVQSYESVPTVVV